MKKPHHQKTKYHLGQVFFKNDPARTRYVITELRYGIDKWDPQSHLTIHIDGELGRLSFQGGIHTNILQIGFKNTSTGDTHMYTAQEIEEYTKNRHLIF